MKNTQKTILQSLLIVLFVISGFFLTSTHTARAQFGVPVMDFITEFATNWTGLETSLTEIKEYALDTIAYAAQQAILQVIEDNITGILAANTNAIVQDLNAELLNLQQQVSTELSNEIADVSFQSCNFFPDFKNELRKLVETNNRNNAINKLKVKVKCSVDGITVNINGFINDFNQGGWTAFKELAKNPEANTPFGVLIQTQAELNKQKEEQQQVRTEELRWGDGIRALRDTTTGLIKLPGKLVGDMVTEAFSSRFRRRANADEITEIIGSMITGLVSNYISGVF